MHTDQWHLFCDDKILYDNVDSLRQRKPHHSLFRYLLSLSFEKLMTGEKKLSYCRCRLYPGWCMPACTQQFPQDFHRNSLCTKDQHNESHGLAGQNEEVERKYVGKSSNFFYFTNNSHIHSIKWIFEVPVVNLDLTDSSSRPSTFTTVPPTQAWVVPHLYFESCETQISGFVHLMLGQNQNTSFTFLRRSPTSRVPFTVRAQDPEKKQLSKKQLSRSPQCTSRHHAPPTSTLSQFFAEYDAWHFLPLEHDSLTFCKYQTPNSKLASFSFLGIFLKLKVAVIGWGSSSSKASTRSGCIFWDTSNC